MDNFNKKEQCFCKYCGKECLSRNSLIQHEIRCKENPNKIVVKWGWIKGKKRDKSSTKDRIWIHKDNKEKMVFQHEYESKYKNEGWITGLSKNHANKSLGSTGIGKTIEIENKRKEKISTTMKNNPNAGGYRKGSGRGHKGWYKNIFCDSSWELAFVIYHIENNLYIERCKEKRTYTYKNEIHTYLPDFITNEGIIEIKGYVTNESLEKSKQNPDVIVLYEKDMKKYLEYVIDKYGKEFWKCLYNGE